MRRGRRIRLGRGVLKRSGALSAVMCWDQRNEGRRRGLCSVHLRKKNKVAQVWENSYHRKENEVYKQKRQTIGGEKECKEGKSRLRPWRCGE